VAVVACRFCGCRVRRADVYPRVWVMAGGSDRALCTCVRMLCSVVDDMMCCAAVGLVGNEKNSNEGWTKIASRLLHGWFLSFGS
jgi:hypothetical protein